MTIQENVPLAPLTTLQVGGAARYFCEGRSEDEIREAVQFANEHALPLFILGGGSNLLIADSGWPGLVLKIAVGGIKTLPDSSGHAIVFEVGAGVVWDDLVAHAVSENCAGIECLSGIPGSVGGTPVQNVGAYGQEVSETIESVRALELRHEGGSDTSKNRVVVLTNADCGFRYRSSIFNREMNSEKRAEHGRYIILQVSYRLHPNGAPTLKYVDLQRYFAERNLAGSPDESQRDLARARAFPSLLQTREAILEVRRRKGMLIVPGDEDCRSAGSFFKNPVLSERQFQDLAARASSSGLAVPNYPALDTRHKVSAAWLVEHSGFTKGMRMGSAGISSKHALALINPGYARAADILELKDAIQSRVEKDWGVQLVPEPVFVGF
jgi:UDP-N-acetylmuramate dehydrogenase